MKFKKCIPVLLVLSLVLNVFLVKKTIDDYHEFQRQGIWGLNYAAFHLVTLMPEMEDPEDWTIWRCIISFKLCPRFMEAKTGQNYARLLGNSPSDGIPNLGNSIAPWSRVMWIRSWNCAAMIDIK